MGKHSSKFYSYWEADDYTENPRDIKAIEFILTTYCNLRCPECAQNIPRIAWPEHYSLEYIQDAASCLYGIEQVSISGGEPTAHPQFREMVPQFKKWFGCQSLALTTNGYHIIEHEDLLHHFDDILLSHYPHNRQEAEFLAQRQLDSRPPEELTVHLTTARRAKNPGPCRRANFIMYFYGRLYPCCALPSGYEGIGIPLTPNWRVEIAKVLLPCADCSFAEELDSSTVHGTVKKPSFQLPDNGTPGSEKMRPAWRWSLPRPNIQIYGLDLDSWMGWEAEIVINPPEDVSRLLIDLESHAPENLHPITLGFENEYFTEDQTHIIAKPGKSRIEIALPELPATLDKTVIQMKSDTTYVPSRIDPTSQDSRELGIRVVSLHYNKETSHPSVQELLHYDRCSREQLLALLEEQQFLIKKKERRVQELRKTLDEQGQRANELSQIIRTQQQELLTKDYAIQAKRQELTAKEALMQAQQGELVEQEASILLQQQLEEKEQVIHMQRHELIAKEHVIQSLILFRYSSLQYWLFYLPIVCIKKVYRTLRSTLGQLLQYLPILVNIKKMLLEHLQKKIHKMYRTFHPKLGQLSQYPPIPLYVPKQYHHVLLPAQESLPVVSIVTPSFNQAQFLERTIKSILQQHYPKLEYLLQDGASTDGTHSILEQYQEQFAFVESCQDTGQANAINLGFQRASGEIMAWLNSDDMLLPGTLAYVVNYFLAHPEVDVVYGHRVLINEQDEEIGRWILPPHDDAILRWADWIPQETLFWRRSIWEQVGGALDESFDFALDWDLLLRFEDAGAAFVRLPRFLAAFRVHAAQKTSQTLEERGYQEMYRLRERYHGRYVSHHEASRHTRLYMVKHLVWHVLYRGKIISC